MSHSRSADKRCQEELSEPAPWRLFWYYLLIHSTLLVQYGLHSMAPVSDKSHTAHQNTNRSGNLNFVIVII